jgi:hypothetical protein
MSALSAKIEDMKNLSWQMTVVLGLVVLVIGVLAFAEKDVRTVSDAILFIMVAMGYAELREIKSQTNGNQTKLMEELAAYRRASQEVTTKALESAPLIPPTTESK